MKGTYFLSSNERPSYLVLRTTSVDPNVKPPRELSSNYLLLLLIESSTALLVLHAIEAFVAPALMTGLATIEPHFRGEPRR
jgi:hypothetical protein